MAFPGMWALTRDLCAGCEASYVFAKTGATMEQAVAAGYHQAGSIFESGHEDD
jgi:hypothetical protein